MADKQQTAITPQPATSAKEVLRSEHKQAEDERWVQDALEDDDVREALKVLHSREKSR